MNSNFAGRQRLAIVVLLLGALLCLPALADPPARVGRLAYFSGAVSLAPAALESEWSSAILNRPVTTGDRLWTDRDGRAEIRIGSTAVRMAADTSVEVLNLDDRTTQLSVTQGTLNLRVRHLGTDQHFEIDTPAAALTLRQAGDYRIDVDPDGTGATVSVRRGALDVAGSDLSFYLSEGQGAALYANAPDYEVIALPPLDAFDRFCLERDRRAEDLRATRYVPLEMTGYEDLDAYGSWQTVLDYGTVCFPSNVSPGWAPYRDGRWMWVEPWGWTWVDAQPWGFAPFHYGRWIQTGGRWCWHPGPRHGRPVYAPALVVFVGGSGLYRPSGSLVGWIPLGYREPYVPWYTASPGYVRGVNPGGGTDFPRARHGSGMGFAHRAAATAVAGTVFARGAAIRPAALAPEAARQLAQAPVLTGSAPIAPAQQSLIVRPAHVRPPAHLLRRPVVAVNAPPPRPAPFEQRQAEITKQPNQPLHVRPLPGATASVAPPMQMIQPRIGRPHMPPAAQASQPAPATLPQPPTAIAPRPRFEPPHRAPAEISVPPAQQPAAPQTRTGPPPVRHPREELRAPPAPPGMPPQAMTRPAPQAVPHPAPPVLPQAVPHRPPQAVPPRLEQRAVPVVPQGVPAERLPGADSAPPPGQSSEPTPPRAMHGRGQRLGNPEERFPGSPR